MLLLSFSFAANLNMVKTVGATDLSWARHADLVASVAQRAARAVARRRLAGGGHGGIFPRAVPLASSPVASASLSTSASRKDTRQGSSHLSFWERWEKASAGEFHQGVGFDQDKKNDERFRQKMANQVLHQPASVLGTRTVPL